jgi:hypothetical protein
MLFIMATDMQIRSVEVHQSGLWTHKNMLPISVTTIQISSIEVHQKSPLDSRENDLFALFDPGLHFCNLERLEVAVVKRCGVKDYAFQHGVVDATRPGEGFGIDQCIRDLTGIVEAFNLLRETGFCSSHFTMLVQDPDRSEVAVAYPISDKMLKGVLQKTHDAKTSLGIKELEGLNIEEDFLDDLTVSKKMCIQQKPSQIYTSSFD